jgi:hypothetical protein
MTLIDMQLPMSTFGCIISTNNPSHHFHGRLISTQVFSCA